MTLKELKTFLNKNIELKYKNSLDYVITRTGELTYYKQWFYLYDQGKSNNQFNLAFQTKDVKNIISIKELINEERKVDI